jgi:hypothetical protein
MHRDSAGGRFRRRAGALTTPSAPGSGHHKPDRTDEAFDRLADRFGADPRVTVAAEGAVLTY